MGDGGRTRMKRNQREKEPELQGKAERR